MPFNDRGAPDSPRKARTPPAAETSQEAAYLKSLGEKQNRVSIKLKDGETVQGWMEYYDKDMVRLTRDDQPNLFIFKRNILYIAEDGESGPQAPSGIGQEQPRRASRQKRGAIAGDLSPIQPPRFRPRHGGDRPRSRRPADGLFCQHVKIEYKGEADLVTVADRASEKLIRERIGALWPGHDILGEEEGLVDTGSDYRWYVDPLDGTTNFAHGFPVFCVSMALEHKGRRIAGVVYDPTREEMFAAEQGSGAYLNQEPIRVSPPRSWQKGSWRPAFPATNAIRIPIFISIIRSRLRTHGVRRAGSAALDLCYVAAGRLDGFWEFNLNPWDTAAGVLLVEEAGGRVTDFQGGAFQIDSRETLASNGTAARSAPARVPGDLRGPRPRADGGSEGAQPIGR